MGIAAGRWHFMIYSGPDSGFWAFVLGHGPAVVYLDYINTIDDCIQVSFLNAFANAAADSKPTFDATAAVLSVVSRSRRRASCIRQTAR